MITSPNNPRVAEAVKLKKRASRDRARRFLVEGAQAVREALRAPERVERLFHGDGSSEIVQLAGRQGIPAHEVSGAVMGRLTSTVTPQGLVAVAPFVDRPIGAIDETADSVVLLHSVRDPGNAGTILRSADAAGVGAVLFADTSVDVYNPKAVRASAGSLFHLPVVRDVGTADAMSRLRAKGCQLLAMAPDGEADLFEIDLTTRTAFVFGNEAWGLPGEVADLADVRVRIPLPGRAESLNLAAAASVSLFEWARQARVGRRVALEAVIAAAAHDIRSPLTAMKGFGFALQRRWDQMSDGQRELMFRGIAHDTDRMDQIVRLLVDAARIVSGQLDLFPERVDVAAVVASLNESLSLDPEHPEVLWRGGDVQTMLDPDRLRSVLAAFVESLVWWAREGDVEVEASHRDGRLELLVSRHGTDLSPAQAEALFQARRPGTGSGSKIGLFVARGIAQAEGGTADAAVVDRRLTFRLEVPAPTSSR